MDDDPLIILIIDTIFPNKKREEKKITKNMSLAVSTIRGWNRRRAYRKHFARVHAPLRPACVYRDVTAPSR